MPNGLPTPILLPIPNGLPMPNGLPIPNGHPESNELIHHASIGLRDAAGSRGPCLTSSAAATTSLDTSLLLSHPVGVMKPRKRPWVQEMVFTWIFRHALRPSCGTNFQIPVRQSKVSPEGSRLRMMKSPCKASSFCRPEHIEVKFELADSSLLSHDRFLLLPLPKQRGCCQHRRWPPRAIIPRVRCHRLAAKLFVSVLPHTLEVFHMALLQCRRCEWRTPALLVPALG